MRIGRRDLMNGNFHGLTTPIVGAIGYGRGFGPFLATDRPPAPTGPDVSIRTDVKDAIKVERPRLHKVILINDDYTPREFVVTVLKAEFRMSEDQALRVMITAHKRGACVVAVFTKDVALAKATNATDLGRSQGYPLLFTTEPEE
jgi:ATP-dependent Clp protease adaptor protein ClpS